MIDHPHAGEEARRIAEAGTLLRTQVGSGVHGTAISGQDDRDRARAGDHWARSTADGEVGSGT